MFILAGVISSVYDPSVRHIVIVGLMGSGKTTVGAAVATRLHRPHLDSDADLLAETGLTAREIADRDGIDALHRLEAAHLLAALRCRDPIVLSAAASTLEHRDCLAALRAPDVLVVWLHAAPAVLASRLRSDDHRPDLGLDIERLIERQADRREPAAAAVADLELDAGRPPGDLVADVLTAAATVG